ncbi:hypothetical protein GCM10011321_06790 [Youhaiella tibetensis]|uniref:Uncharacterized protein n=1 Tax=Paradevosia tibetensis TaxID=1447062 RepID=A0A5B9DRQ8_9HYPH|nr:hypothetical protein [Youhaiella tibetensis]AKR56088.1 hypothetical protein XM25_09815 [Devosia sp. H5989]QEE21138.1 hypothetical protein FNA67_13565 [Youhaiella tibetensis]GGF17655.1 hypothetical protein GCM10011321_06790 [Youhaiella tibetensis]
MKYALFVPALAIASTLAFAPAAFAEVIGGQSFTPDQREAVQTRCNELVRHDSEADTLGGGSVGGQSADSGKDGSSSDAIDLSYINLHDCRTAGFVG